MNNQKLKIGVLALQGAVREHIRSLEASGVEAVAVKNAAELSSIDGLVLPGGESTTIRRLINVCNLTTAIEDYKASNKPIFGTCAGLILMAKTIEDENPSQLAVMDIKVKRNSFGRQVDSFETNIDLKHIGADFPAVFIRAPHISDAGPEVEILGEFENRIVMARQGNYLGCSFHPELTEDHRITEYFIKMVNAVR